MFFSPHVFKNDEPDHQLASVNCLPSIEQQQTRVVLSETPMIVFFNQRACMQLKGIAVCGARYFAMISGYGRAANPRIFAGHVPSMFQSHTSSPSSGYHHQ